MTDLIQDFTVYAGSDNLPVFTCYSDTANTTILDISSISDITLIIQRDLATAVALTKTKSGGGIAFVTDGTDGKFKVTLTAADTTALTGRYIYQASITDNTGLISVVSLGVITVGRAPLWTYSGDPTTSNKDAIRFLIGDVDSQDQQLMDGEINYTFILRGTVYGAAAQCCRHLSSRYSRRADSVQADLRTLYSSIAKAYATRAKEYENREAIGGGAIAYAGGISQGDKTRQEASSDRVTPQFNLGMTDNSIPMTQGGNELLSENHDVP